jgi:sec-independent protein translocase protein TatA
MFGSFGFMELLLIFIIVLIIFGAGKLPQLGEGVGKAIKGFKKSVNEPEADNSENIGQTQIPPGASVQQELQAAKPEGDAVRTKGPAESGADQSGQRRA